MEQDNQQAMPADIASLGGKSWTAYVRVALVGMVLFIISVTAWGISVGAGLVVSLLALAFVVYQVLLIKSYHLYFDDAGVWVFSGVLPWNKGVAGVKWRDLDEAVYFQSMGSWLFKSYSIRIGHRFTKSSEVLLTHWARGHEAVMTKNQQHQELVRTGALR